MPSLSWTPQAVADVQRLYRFLAPRDLKAARYAVSEIRNSVKILAHQPASGRPVEELPSAYREWPVSFGNRVLYRIDTDVVSILAVRHQRETGWS
ncbi:type II toxin-antitoxin system RelE/ParE family toxin [Erwinia endophytica]|uniref:type II toxin-antitoxin system RelE/ParE family toxin n=1 Tax=Erwinia endophytica TaxID=1563158 RepID=UPI001265DE20|nr:type II toxin-antitoxin system RelE/ParE family toxin [Erwinia endophytica]KAB8313499.1 type II toxin-antitoxin system RelE/ParE family toxin [Erwinia endophytica]